MDPDAPYINGDPTIGRQGSIPPAAAFEHPMREIVGVISKSKIGPTELDLLQMAKAVRSQRMNFCDDTGQVNVLSVSFDPPLTTYTVGLIVRVRVYVANTGPSTIDAGAGRVPIHRPNGAATQANDMPAGAVVELVYDGAAFQIVNFGGAGGGGGGEVGGDTTINYYALPYTVDTGPVNSIVAAFSPAFTTQTAGMAFLVKIANTNMGPTTITVDGLTTKQIRPNADPGGQCLPGDVVKDSIVLFVYDGTNYFFVPNPSIPNDATITVPAMYATTDAAMYALGRKSWGRGTTVTIQMAVGVFGQLNIFHPCGDSLVIKGTMKGPPPGHDNFSGNDLTMLRARYGTEIRVSNKGGIQNFGPGRVHVKDLLVTGNGNWGVTVAAGADTVFSTLFCENVAVYGFDFGYRATGDLLIWNGSSTHNSSCGVAADAGGRVTVSGCYCLYNGFAGAFCGQGAFMSFSGGSSEGNTYGVYCVGQAYAIIGGAEISGNSLDLLAAEFAYIGVQGSTVYTYSPAPFGTVGNMESIIRG